MLGNLLRSDRWKEYVDPVAALVAAVVFAILAAVGVVTGQLLAGVTLGVLAAVCGVMIRERYVIEQAKARLDDVPNALESVTRGISKIERLVDAVTSSDPFEILDYEVEWDIIQADGALAYGRKRKKLRFNQEETVTLTELTQASRGHVGDWQFMPETIEQVGALTVNGESHILLSLGSVYRRNEELEFSSERKIEAVFVDKVNSVSLRVREPIHHLCIRVLWAEGAPPQSVTIEELPLDGRPNKFHLPRNDLQLSADKRALIEKHYSYPPRGQKIVVSWRR